MQRRDDTKAANLLGRRQPCYCCVMTTKLERYRCLVNTKFPQYGLDIFLLQTYWSLGTKSAQGNTQNSLKASPYISTVHSCLLTLKPHLPFHISNFYSQVVTNYISMPPLANLTLIEDCLNILLHSLQYTNMAYTIQEYIYSLLLACDSTVYCGFLSRIKVLH